MILRSKVQKPFSPVSIWLLLETEQSVSYIIRFLKRGEDTLKTDKKIPVQITVTGIHKIITDVSHETGMISSSHAVLEAADSLEADVTSETAEGIFSKRGSSIYLRYYLPSIENMIKISPSSVEIIRKVSADPRSNHKLESRTIYKAGKREYGIQSTPYGRLDTCTDTESIACIENEADLSCTIQGIMYINNSPSSVFELKIEAVIL